MISVILCGNDEATARAKKRGFVEQAVLVRHESILSNDLKRKEEVEAMIRREIRPYQFLVADYWGMGPD